MRNMHKAILSDHEREIIEKFTKEGVRLNGINILRHRLRQNLPRIREDLALIEKFLGEG